jgi:hypothetical protein
MARGGGEAFGCLFLLFACLFPPAWPALFVLLLIQASKGGGR